MGVICLYLEYSRGGREGRFELMISNSKLLFIYLFIYLY